MNQTTNPLNPFSIEDSLEQLSQRDSNLQPLAEAQALDPINLTRPQLGQLLSLVRGASSALSPVQDVERAKITDALLINVLTNKGWFVRKEKDNSLWPHLQAVQAIKSLVAPETSIQLILGTPTEMYATTLFSSDGYRDDKLVIYMHKESEDRFIVYPGLSPAHISDALLAHLLPGPKEGFVFDLDLGEEVMLLLLTILDLIMARRLEAKLRSEIYPVLNFSVEQIMTRFTEIRLGEDLMWLSVLIPYLFPYMVQDLQEDQVGAMLDQLVQQEGLIMQIPSGAYQPSDLILALSESLLPVLGYASLAIINNEEAGLHAAFMIGPNINLVVKLFSQNGKNRVVINGMERVFFSRILFDLGLPAKP